MKGWARVSLCGAFGALSVLSVGCVIRETPRETVVREEVVVGDPVVVEPAPVERVYVYERGYPPGTYVYGGYYYYGGRRYERDVFVTKVVNVNIRENRYVNVEQNRVAGKRIEEKQVVSYQKTGGKVQPAAQRRQEAAQNRAAHRKDQNRN